MLKVVGASWYKTKISSTIILGALLLAFGAIFIINMERPSFDGTFCATAYWNQMSGFRLEFWGQQNDLDNIPKGVARVCYKDTTFENGWSQIEIETHAIYPDRIQALAAGILEGALTWKNIYHHWTNTIHTPCIKDDESQEFCTWLRDTISNNYENVKKMAEHRADHDHYWYQIRLFYLQLEGMAFGWRKGVMRSAMKRDGLEIPPEDFFLMNAAADIKDLRVFYDNFIVKKNDKDENNNGRVAEEVDLKGKIIESRSSMVVNLLENDGLIKLLLGHTAAKNYSSMLRILKKYKFNFHFSSDINTHIVPGSNIIFTGYPGILSSTDDFYTIHGRHSNLIVSGVSIQNNNPELWKNVNFENSVLLSARLMAANRLAHNGRSWSRVMAKHPGTGAKQWIVVDRRVLHHLSTIEKSAETQPERQIAPMKMFSLNDYNFIDEKYQFKSNEDSLKMEKESSSTSTISGPENENYQNSQGLLWLVDQLPGRLYAEDVTQTIFEVGHIFTNGIPYFEETFNISHGTEAQQLAKLENQVIQQNITNLGIIGKFLKQRSVRGDLIESRPLPFGNIDLKLLSDTNRGEMEFYAKSGPTHYDLDTKVLTTEAFKSHNSGRDIPVRSLTKKNDPFKWSNSKLDAKHNGHPDAWNFEKISPKWAWTSS